MKQETNSFKLAVAVDLPRGLPGHVACFSHIQCVSFPDKTSADETHVNHVMIL